MKMAEGKRRFTTSKLLGQPLQLKWFGGRVGNINKWSYQGCSKNSISMAFFRQRHTLNIRHRRIRFVRRVVSIYCFLKMQEDNSQAHSDKWQVKLGLTVRETQEIQLQGMDKTSSQEGQQLLSSKWLFPHENAWPLWPESLIFQGKQ